MNIFELGWVLFVQYALCFAAGYGLAWITKKDSRHRYLAAIIIGALAGSANSVLNLMLVMN